MLRSRKMGRNFCKIIQSNDDKKLLYFTVNFPKKQLAKRYLAYSTTEM